MKDIVIIGGMGPQASLEFHRRIIDKAAQRGAHKGQDYPLIRHVSIPVTDFINSIANRVKALEKLKINLDHLYLWRKHRSHFGLQHSPSTGRGA
ncbi:MAG: hypothetical protein ACXWLH_05325 [Candidatus Saccharimonadales bacterium]